jgi:hypothetical protein
MTGVDAEANATEVRLTVPDGSGWGSSVAAKRDQRIGNWRGLLWLSMTQIAVAVPAFAIAFYLGGTHLQQVALAVGVVWPLVILSYLPLLRWPASDSVVVPMYLAIMIRLFGTLAIVIVVRQIAAPLAPNTWFAYISAFYLAGLASETSVAVWHLQTVAGTTHVGSHQGKHRS